MSGFTFCSSDDILLSLSLRFAFNSLISLSNCSTSGNWDLMQFTLEEPVFDEMFDADADPKVSFGLLVS